MTTTWYEDSRIALTTDELCVKSCETEKRCNQTRNTASGCATASFRVRWEKIEWLDIHSAPAEDDDASMEMGVVPLSGNEKGAKKDTAVAFLEETDAKDQQGMELEEMEKKKNIVLLYLWVADESDDFFCRNGDEEEVIPTEATISSYPEEEQQQVHHRFHESPLRQHFDREREKKTNRGVCKDSDIYHHKTHDRGHHDNGGEGSGFSPHRCRRHYRPLCLRLAVTTAAAIQRFWFLFLHYQFQRLLQSLGAAAAKKEEEDDDEEVGLVRVMMPRQSEWRTPPTTRTTAEAAATAVGDDDGDNSGGKRRTFTIGGFEGFLLAHRLLVPIQKKEGEEEGAEKEKTVLAFVECIWKRFRELLPHPVSSSSSSSCSTTFFFLTAEGFHKWTSPIFPHTFQEGYSSLLFTRMASLATAAAAAVTIAAPDGEENDDDDEAEEEGMVSLLRTSTEEEEEGSTPTGPRWRRRSSVGEEEEEGGRGAASTRRPFTTTTTGAIRTSSSTAAALSFRAFYFSVSILLGAATPPPPRSSSLCLPPSSSSSPAPTTTAGDDDDDHPARRGRMMTVMSLSWMRLYFAFSMFGSYPSREGEGEDVEEEGEEDYNRCYNAENAKGEEEEEEEALSPPEEEEEVIAVSRESFTHVIAFLISLTDGDAAAATACSVSDGDDNDTVTAPSAAMKLMTTMVMMGCGGEDHQGEGKGVKVINSNKDQASGCSSNITTGSRSTSGGGASAPPPPPPFRVVNRIVEVVFLALADLEEKKKRKKSSESPVQYGEEDAPIMTWADLWQLIQTDNRVLDIFLRHGVLSLHHHQDEDSNPLLMHHHQDEDSNPLLMHHHQDEDSKPLLMHHHQDRRGAQSATTSSSSSSSTTTGNNNALTTDVGSSNNNPPPLLAPSLFLLSIMARRSNTMMMKSRHSSSARTPDDENGRNIIMGTEINNKMKTMSSSWMWSVMASLKEALSTYLPDLEEQLRMEKQQLEEQQQRRMRSAPAQSSSVADDMPHQQQILLVQQLLYGDDAMTTTVETAAAQRGSSVRRHHQQEDEGEEEEDIATSAKKVRAKASYVQFPLCLPTSPSSGADGVGAGESNHDDNADELLQMTRTTPGWHKAQFSEEHDHNDDDDLGAGTGAVSSSERSAAAAANLEDLLFVSGGGENVCHAEGVVDDDKGEPVPSTAAAAPRAMLTIYQPRLYLASWHTMTRSSSADVTTDGDGRMIDHQAESPQGTSAAAAASEVITTTKDLRVAFNLDRLLCNFLLLSSDDRNSSSCGGGVGWQPLAEEEEGGGVPGSTSSTSPTSPTTTAWISANGRYMLRRVGEQEAKNLLVHVAGEYHEHLVGNPHTFLPRVLLVFSVAIEEDDAIEEVRGRWWQGPCSSSSRRGGWSPKRKEGDNNTMHQQQRRGGGGGGHRHAFFVIELLPVASDVSFLSTFLLDCRRSGDHGRDERNHSGSANYAVRQQQGQQQGRRQDDDDPSRHLPSSLSLRTPIRLAEDWAVCVHEQLEIDMLFLERCGMTGYRLFLAHDEDEAVRCAREQQQQYPNSPEALLMLLASGTNTMSSLSTSNTTAITSSSSATTSDGSGCLPHVLVVGNGGLAGKEEEEESGKQGKMLSSTTTPHDATSYRQTWIGSFVQWWLKSGEGWWPARRRRSYQSELDLEERHHPEQQQSSQKQRPPRPTPTTTNKRKGWWGYSVVGQQGELFCIATKRLHQLKSTTTIHGEEGCDEEISRGWSTTFGLSPGWNGISSSTYQQPAYRTAFQGNRGGIPAAAAAASSSGRGGGVGAAASNNTTDGGLYGGSGGGVVTLCLCDCFRQEPSSSLWGGRKGAAGYHQGVATDDDDRRCVGRAKNTTTTMALQYRETLQDFLRMMIISDNCYISSSSSSGGGGNNMDGGSKKVAGRQRGITDGGGGGVVEGGGGGVGGNIPPHAAAEGGRTAKRKRRNTVFGSSETLTIPVTRESGRRCKLIFLAERAEVVLVDAFSREVIYTVNGGPASSLTVSRLTHLNAPQKLLCLREVLHLEGQQQEGLPHHHRDGKSKPSLTVPVVAAAPSAPYFDRIKLLSFNSHFDTLTAQSAFYELSHHHHHRHDDNNHHPVAPNNQQQQDGDGDGPRPAATTTKGISLVNVDLRMQGEGEGEAALRLTHPASSNSGGVFYGSSFSVGGLLVDRATVWDWVRQPLCDCSSDLLVVSILTTSTAGTVGGESSSSETVHGHLHRLLTEVIDDEGWCCVLHRRQHQRQERTKPTTTTTAVIHVFFLARVVAAVRLANLEACYNKFTSSCDDEEGADEPHGPQHICCQGKNKVGGIAVGLTFTYWESSFAVLVGYSCVGCPGTEAGAGPGTEAGAGAQDGDNNDMQEEGVREGDDRKSAYYQHQHAAAMRKKKEDCVFRILKAASSRLGTSYLDICAEFDHTLVTTFFLHTRHHRHDRQQRQQGAAANVSSSLSCSRRGNSSRVGREEKRRKGEVVLLLKEVGGVGEEVLKQQRQKECLSSSSSSSASTMSLCSPEVSTYYYTRVPTSPPAAAAAAVVSAQAKAGETAGACQQGMKSQHRKLTLLPFPCEASSGGSKPAEATDSSSSAHYYTWCHHNLQFTPKLPWLQTLSPTPTTSPPLDPDARRRHQQHPTTSIPRGGGRVVDVIEKDDPYQQAVAVDLFIAVRFTIRDAFVEIFKGANAFFYENSLHEQYHNNDTGSVYGGGVAVILGENRLCWDVSPQVTLRHRFFETPGVLTSSIFQHRQNHSFSRKAAWGILPNKVFPVLVESFKKEHLIVDVCDGTLRIPLGQVAISLEGLACSSSELEKKKQKRMSSGSHQPESSSTLNLSDVVESPLIHHGITVGIFRAGLSLSAESL